MNNESNNNIDLNNESNNQNIDITNNQSVTDNTTNIQNFNAYQQFNATATNQQQVPPVQPINNNVYQQPISDPSSINNTQNLQQSSKPQSNTTKMIIGIVIGLVAAIVVGFITYALLTKKANNEKDYENPAADTISNNGADTIKYKNFKFKKLNGYTYKVGTESLLVGNNDVIYSIGVYEAEYSKIKNSKEELMQEINNQGYIIENLQVKTVNNKELITMEASANNRSIIMTITKATTGITFMAAAAVPTYVIDYTTLDGLVEVLNNTSYSDVNESYASTLPTEYDINVLVDDINFE